MHQRAVVGSAAEKFTVFVKADALTVVRGATQKLEFIDGELAVIVFELEADEALFKITFSYRRRCR